jgi:hypothetical protein
MMMEKQILDEPPVDLRRVVWIERHHTRQISMQAVAREQLPRRRASASMTRLRD